MDGALSGVSLSILLPLWMSLLLLGQAVAVTGQKQEDKKEREDNGSTVRSDDTHQGVRITHGYSNRPLRNTVVTSNMTYVPVGDMDPGGGDNGEDDEVVVGINGGTFDVVVDGDGVGGFNAVETTVVWLSECQSNGSVLWKLTSPVCSTKFTSFLVFVVVTLVFAVITLWTILGNILVLWALYRYRYLRTMSNCLIGNLAVSDLLLAITVLPISASNDLLGFWVLGKTMCTVWLCIDVLYCTASIWGLCTIAFDRFTATVYPMWYHDQRSTRKALAYIAFVWVFSIIISLAPFIGWQEMISGFYIYQPEINRYVCMLFSTQSYVIYSAMGSFVLPSCFMTFLYVQIFVVLHRQADTLSKKSSVTSHTMLPGGGGLLANGGCPTIAISNPHDEASSCVVTRDITASTFMAEETTYVDNDDTEREEEEEEEEEQGDDDENEEGYNEDRVSFTTTEFNDDDEDDASPPATETCLNYELPPCMTRKHPRSPPTEAEVLLDDNGSPATRRGTRLSHITTVPSPPLAAGQGRTRTSELTKGTGGGELDGHSNHSVASSLNMKSEVEVSTLLRPLRDQRSNSLKLEMETSFGRTGKNKSDSSPFLLSKQAKSDFLTVSTCDIPAQFKLKKSRSAAFNLEGSSSSAGALRRGDCGGPGGCHSPLSKGVPRSKSAATLCSGEAGQHRRRGDDLLGGKGAGRTAAGAASSTSLHRFSLAWQGKRSNHMTTSMRRRFQLREQRATKRMLLIMASFFVCWVPFTIMYMLRSLCTHCQTLDENVIAFIIWLGYANSSLNPLLYTLFNDDFRKAFKKLLTFRRQRRPFRAAR